MDGKKLDRLVGLGVAELTGRQARLEAKKLEKPSAGVAAGLRMIKAALTRALDLEKTGVAHARANKPDRLKFNDAYRHKPHGDIVTTREPGIQIAIHRPYDGQRTQFKISCSSHSFASWPLLHNRIFPSLDGPDGAIATIDRVLLINHPSLSAI